MISPRLKAVIARELNVEDLELTEQTLASEVPGWDSLKHVSILTAIEDAFGIRFGRLEILKLKNVGELQSLVDSKLRGKAQ